MKIIGKTEDGYIIEASQDEVANLIGYYSKYDDRSRSQQLKRYEDWRICWNHAVQ